MTMVDAHLHVFSDDPARYPYDGRWGMIPQEPTPVEELIACMDANGVDKAVMVQGAAYLYDNRYMADCRARFPDRLAAVALLDPRAGCRGSAGGALGARPDPGLPPLLHPGPGREVAARGEP